MNTIIICILHHFIEKKKIFVYTNIINVVIFFLKLKIYNHLSYNKIFKRKRWRTEPFPRFLKSRRTL